jgi:lipid II:glycine glycyltransferase (peptidoglycan interpeptide bridge formation enzyme)
MHPKTRYNIRLGKKKGVFCREGDSAEYFEIFWSLLCQTARRQHIKVHEKSYYEKLLRTRDDAFLVSIFIAEYENTPLAAFMIVYYRTVAIYLHGGTSDLHRNVMAPHYLQWFTIQSAQKRGCHYYDFYGIASRDAYEDHPLYSITRYKRGFGGLEVNYMGTYEFAFCPTWYRVYKFAKAIF